MKTPFDKNDASLDYWYIDKNGNKINPKEDFRRQFNLEKSQLPLKTKIFNCILYNYHKINGRKPNSFIFNLKHIYIRKIKYKIAYNSWKLKLFSPFVLYDTYKDLGIKNTIRQTYNLLTDKGRAKREQITLGKDFNKFYEKQNSN